MATTSIPFPTSSAPGELPGEGVGLLVNCMPQKNEDELSWLRMPGLARFATITPAVEGPRGALVVGQQVVTAWKDKVALTTMGGASTVGSVALPGSSPVTMARNMRLPTPDVAIVTENGAYKLDMATGIVSANTDSDLTAPNSVSYFSGYFLYTKANGQVLASELQQHEVKALSNTLADSNPDGLYRGINIGDVWLAMGSETIEAYQDVGASPFPLQRTTTIPTGLMSPWAVAGSVEEWDRPLLFVAADFTVRMMDGLTPTIVSSKDVSLDIYKQRSARDGFRAQVYVQGENAFWSLSCPAWTWEYNLATQSWLKRQSYLRPDWRVRSAVQFGERSIALDTMASQLVEITSDAFDEVGEPLIAEAFSGPVKQFPTGMRVPRAFFDFTVGLGRVTAPEEQVDPAVYLSWSHDGGATWANPIRRSLGRQGEFRRLIQLNNMGRSSHHGTRFKWSVHDPVHVRFRGAILDDLRQRRPATVGLS